MGWTVIGPGAGGVLTPSEQESLDAADLSGSPLTAIDDQIFPTNLADVVTDGTFCVRNTPTDVAVFGLADHVDGDVLKKVGVTWKRLLRPVAGVTVVWLTTFGKPARFVDEPVAGNLPVFVNTLDTGEDFSVPYIGTDLPGQISFDGTLLIGNTAGGLTTVNFGNAAVLLLTGTLVVWIRDTVNPERSGAYNLIVNNAGTGDYTLRRDYNFRDSSSFIDGQTFFVGSGSGGDEANKNYLISLTQQFIINTTSLAIVEGTIANLTQVPTVVAQEFASDIIRFFGELGLPTTTPNSVWTLINGAEVTLVQDIVFGKSQQVVNVKDTSGATQTSIENSISSQQWLDSFTFGAEFGGIIKAIAPSATDAVFFIGVGVSGVLNPTASTSDQRFGAFFLKDPSTNFIVLDDLQGATNVILNGDPGIPKVELGDYLTVFVRVDINFTDPRWIVNGIDVGAATFGNSSFTNDVVVIASGSSGGVGNDFNVVNFGITILKEPTTKTFSAAAMAADVIDVITPLIARDFVNIVPDGFPRSVNAKINGTLNNVGGKYKIRTENLAAPESLFNSFRELEKEVTSTGDKISLSNLLDNNNVYFGEFEDVIILIVTAFVSTEDVTVANTVAETTLLGAGNGSLIIPADTTAIGDRFAFSVQGILSSVANPMLRLQLKSGVVLLADTGAQTIGNLANGHWVITGDVVTRTIGATGTVTISGSFITSAGDHFEFVNTVPVTIDTTINRVVDVTVIWGTAAAGNTITAQISSLTKFSSP